MLWLPFANRSLTMGQRSRIEFGTGAILAGAAALLILPLSFLLSFLIAVLVHEVCHYLVLRIMDVGIYNICIGPFGASMETEPMEPEREVLCALAGPLGSFLLVSLCRIFPVISFCALIQGCFNLFPIYPMDGGRVLAGLLEMLKVPGRERILFVIRLITGIAVGCVCLGGFLIWDLGYGALFLGLVLLLRIFPRKTPCKDSSFRVQ